MSNKDWTGDKNSIFKTLGASNHVEEDRQQYDFYATDPKAAEKLLKLETFNNVWECACGQGHLSKVLMANNIHAKSSDFIDRGFGETGIDFLSIENQNWGGDIIINPAYIYAEEFILKALQIIEPGAKVAMFLKLLFLESKGRKDLFRNFPPKSVYISSSRIVCAKNGDFEKHKSSAVCFAWFVWQKGFKGDAVLKWFN